MFTKLHDRRIPIVRVGVSIAVGPMEFKLNASCLAPSWSETNCVTVNCAIDK